MIPYLLSADIVNTILSATLTFSGRVLYPTYAQAARISSLTPLRDQIAAGAEMWVLNSIVFLVPAVFLTIEMLSPRYLRAHPRPMVTFTYGMAKTGELTDPKDEILRS